MAETAAFFNDYMTKKLADKPDMVESIGKVFQFDITGAGTWTIDLVTEGGQVIAGAHDAPDCVITCAQDDWENFLDNPGMAMQLFMTGKLKASNLGLATQLQKILG